MNALLREMREMANELPAGKRRDVYNKLERIEHTFRRANIEPPMSEPIVDPVDESILFERQRQTIYNHMMAGKTITSLQAIREYGITRLSARIMDIEKVYGIIPNRRRIAVRNRNGRNVTVCEYWIDREDAR